MKLAIRSLAKSPGFAATAILTLALGIGASTAMFSVTHSILLTPLPYQNPDLLVAIFEVVEQIRERYPLLPVNAGHYRTWRESNTTFDSLALYNSLTLNLTGDGEPERLDALAVSSNLFRTLGVAPRLGRGFLGEEEIRGRDRVVILTDSLWRRRFGGASDVIGKTISLDAETYEIVGVLPARFRSIDKYRLNPLAPGHGSAEIFKPFGFREELQIDDGGFNFSAIGRLKAGVTAVQAAAELDAILAGIPNGEQFVVQSSVQPLHEAVIKDSRQGLLILMAAVGTLLLIACVNLANLLLGRGLTKRKELALRASLGASRPSLVFSALKESLVLAVFGGAAGALAAIWLTDAMVGLVPAGAPRIEEVQVDPAALGFAMAASIASLLIFGLAPALQAARTDPREALAGGGRGDGEGRSNSLARRSLAAAQVGLSAVLLVVCGLLVHSLWRVLDVDRGFETENILAADLRIPAGKYPNYQETVPAQRAILDSVANAQGIRSAGFIDFAPVSQESGVSPLAPVENAGMPIFEYLLANRRYASRSYFETLGIPLLEGELFDDFGSGQQPIVISQSVAKGLWPDGRSPIGRELTQGNPNQPPFRVVGVVGDVPVDSLERESTLIFYRPYWSQMRREMSLMVRTPLQPAAAAAAVREAVWKVDPELPVPPFRTLESLVLESVSERRFQTTLVLLFGASALLLAGLGVYGVVAHAVSRRTVEFGIRSALGARARDLKNLAVWHGAAPTLVGLAAGWIAALGAGRLMRGLLFGVSEFDAVSYFVAPMLLLVVALVAAYLPARRAARVEPMAALKHE